MTVAIEATSKKIQLKPCSNCPDSPRFTVHNMTKLVQKYTFKLIWWNKTCLL